MTNFFSQLIFKFLSVLLGFAFTVTGPIGSPKPDKVVNTPDDFTPVVRFVVCSDIHLNGDETQQAAIRFANLFNDMYEYAEGCEYKKLDAVIVAGDFTGGGAEKEYQIFNKIVNENKKDETQLLAVLGNFFILKTDGQRNHGQIQLLIHLGGEITAGISNDAVCHNDMLLKKLTGQSRRTAV